MPVAYTATMRSRLGHGLARIGVSLLLAAAVPGLPAGAGESGAEIAVGRPFPDLVLPSLADGRPASVHDFRGTRLVLHIFASW